MTIALALKTIEGVVVGADSTTTFQDQTGAVIQLFNSAQKVFEIGPSTPTFVGGYHFSGCVATYGGAQCGSASWRSVVNDFYREVVSPNPQRTDLPQAFLKYVQNLWSQLATGTIPAGTPIPSTGFILSYVAASQGEVRSGTIQLDTGTATDMVLGDFWAGGGADSVCRILSGYDPGLKNRLLAAGVDAAQFDACALPSIVKLPFPNMPLRDAIDLVHFLIYATIKLHRYNGATPGIGGPIEIAAITADRGFRWIMHKPLSESIGILHGRESL
jgi:hypothetical protein